MPGPKVDANSGRLRASQLIGWFFESVAGHA